MANFDIKLGSNGQNDNYNVPFYIEVLQAGQIVLSAFSTEGNRAGENPTLVKSKTDFVANVETTIRYYNVGKKGNNISFSLINIVNGTVVTTGASVADGRMGEKVFTIPSGAFSGVMSVICHEAYTVDSGVTYSGLNTINGTYSEVVSASSASGFVSSSTPNDVKNPNYVASGAVPTATPVLVYVDATQIRITEMMAGATKTVEITKNGVVLPDLLSVEGSIFLLESLDEGRYKVRVKVPTKGFSAYSNEIDLSITSATPQVTAFDANVSTAGIANFTGVGTIGTASTISAYKNDDPVAVGTVNVAANGTWAYAANSVGNWKFRQLSGSKLLSNPTVNYTIYPAILSAPSLLVIDVAGVAFLEVSGMNANDLLYVYVNNVLRTVPENVTIDNTGKAKFQLNSFANGTKLKFYYKRDLRESFTSGEHTVNLDPVVKLPDLVVTRSNFNLAPNYYIGEKLKISNIYNQAAVVVNKTLNVDYSVNVSTNEYTFLKAATFTFIQRVAGKEDSNVISVEVGALRPLLAKPLPSIFAINVNDTITITNQDTEQYRTIVVYKNDAIVNTTTGDFTVVEGVYKFLKAGAYKFVGQKTDVADSLFSEVVTVSVWAAPVDTPKPTITKVGLNKIMLTFSKAVIVKTITPYKNGEAQVQDASNNSLTYTTDVLPNGTYKYKVQYLGYSMSEFTDEIIINVPVEGAPSFKKFSADLRLGNVPENDIEIGTGASVAEVQNWTDGASIVISMSNTLPKFWVRQKSNPTKVFKNDTYTVTRL